MTQGEAEPGRTSSDPAPAAGDSDAGVGDAGVGTEGSEGEAAAALLEADLFELAAERDELRGAAQRIQADFENYRKRVMREQVTVSERATDRLVEAILPVLDGLELAVVSLAAADEQVRKGVELAVGELVSVLERNGLERFAETGVEFDPNRHEAVMQEDGDGEPRVGAVLRTGYALKGRVLRPAMVKVVRVAESGANRTGETSK
jgi:molecular chaperone GrpE